MKTSKKDQKPKENPKYVNFTLFQDNVPKKFSSLSDFTQKTGISSMVAKDLLDGTTPWYKLWKKNLE